MRRFFKQWIKYSLDRLVDGLLLCLLPFIRWTAARRFQRGTLATLWGTTPILTLPLLSRSDRVLGLHSETLVFDVYYITQSFDRILKGRVAALRKVSPWLLPFYYRALLLWSLFRYDVFHFFFDRGLLECAGRTGVNPQELRWLRWAGKRVYLYAYGADVRTRAATEALGRYHCCLHCDRVGEHCLCNDDEGRANQEIYRRQATALVAMGDMLAYVPGARNLFYWPFDPQRVPLAGVHWDGKRPLRILHVPNHEWAKGSRYLYAALEALQERGVVFELVTLTRASNSRVLEVMQEVDIVADQFLIGWHGYTALEALACGKIVLCAIRAREMLLEPDLCPIVSAAPDTLEEVLAGLARRAPAELAALGLAGRRYVERCYAPEAVAQRLGRLYLETGAFPAPVEHTLRASLARLGAAEEERARRRCA